MPAAGCSFGVTTTVGIFLPRRFAAGEAHQFAWSHELVLINGTTATVKVAHVWLYCS
jgi:hypothetical protein